MSNDLSAFEKVLQSRYSSDIEISHLKMAQKIIDYYAFDLDEIWKFFHGAILFGEKLGFSPGDPRFDNTVLTATCFLDDGVRHFSYISCIWHDVPYIILFSSLEEARCLAAIRRLEKLRTFL